MVFKNLEEMENFFKSGFRRINGRYFVGYVEEHIINNLTELYIEKILERNIDKEKILSYIEQALNKEKLSLLKKEKELSQYSFPCFKKQQERLNKEINSLKNKIEFYNKYNEFFKIYETLSEKEKLFNLINLEIFVVDYI